MKETGRDTTRGVTRQKRIRLVLLIVVIVAAVFGVDWPAVADALSVSHLSAFVIAQPLQILALSLVAYRFSMLCDAEPNEYRVVFRGYMLALGLNSFVPGRMSEFLKISYVKQYSSIKTPTIIAAVLSEKSMDLINLSIFLILGFSSVPLSSENKLAVLAVTAAIFMVFAGIALLARKTHFVQRLRAQETRVAFFFAEMIPAISNSLSFTTFSKVMFITALAWLSSFGVIYVILNVALPSGASLSQTFVVFAAMAIGRAIPGLPGSIGTYEAAIVFSMLPMGYDTEQALAVALTMRASQVAVVTLLGLLVLYRDGTGLLSLFSKNTREKDVH